MSGKKDTMVSYDDAVAIIQDPQADPVTLAKVAYENPEFGANVAAHPRAYPGLLRWIAQFGDERARMTVAQLGYEAQLGPIEDREVEDAVIAAAEANADAVQATAAANDHPVAVETSTVEYEEPQPASFEPQQQTGVDLLSDQFDNINVDASQVTDMSSPDTSAQTTAQAIAQNTAPNTAHNTAQTPQQSPYAQIQATNQYGFTAELAMTTPDTGVMQQIAQYAPELHPALALNPYLYPELLTWLGMLGEPATDAALAQRPQR